jgi:hypothetical protein
VTQAVRFTQDDLQRAHDEWGCNCGPAALAAILGLTLDEAKLHVGEEFQRKRYTNPTLMFDALKRSGAKWGAAGLGRYISRLNWPRYGLARIQWEGPWTQPGVPLKARYRQTHWVGAHTVGAGNIGVFDVNAMANGTGWCSLEDWQSDIVPWILKECVPRANGKWHITHAIEVERG